MKRYQSLFQRFMLLGCLIGVSVMTILAQKPTSALIQVYDESFSTQQSLDEQKEIGRQIYQAAPPGVILGGVRVSGRVNKQIFHSQAEAEQFIETIGQNTRVEKKWTDLEFGAQAPVALLQQMNADRGVIVLLSDGVVSLPRELKSNPPSFADVLIREFGKLPNFRVFALHIGGKPIPNLEKLKAYPHISVISVTDWVQAKNVVETTLKPEISKLSAGGAPPPPPPQASNEKLLWVAISLLTLIIVASTLIYRKNHKPKAPPDVSKPKPMGIPENALRPEDLKPKPVKLVGVVEYTSKNGGAVLGRAIFDDQPCIIGNGFDADLRIPGLRQAKSLGISITFENGKVKIVGYRTRPTDENAELDEILYHDEDLPLFESFVLSDQDSLIFNENHRVSVTVIPENQLDVLPPVVSPVSASSARRARRLGLATAGKSSPSGQT